MSTHIAVFNVSTSFLNVTLSDEYILCCAACRITVGSYMQVPVSVSCQSGVLINIETHCYTSERDDT